MRISEIMNMILPLYRTGTPLTLVGAPGIGKSDTVRKLPDVLSEATGEDFGLVVVEASTLDAPDVIGFLVPTKDPDTGAKAA